MNTDGLFVYYERTYLATYMANMLVLMVRSSHIRGAIACDMKSVRDCIKIRHLGSRAVCSHRHSDLRTYKDREFLKVVASKYFDR
jgi:hypothetical protein